MLNIFDAAPDFIAQTADGHIGFHRWKGAFWSVLILHAGGASADELTALGARQARFEKRQVKILAVEADVERIHTSGDSAKSLAPTGRGWRAAPGEGDGSAFADGSHAISQRLRPLTFPLGGPLPLPGGARDSGDRTHGRLCLAADPDGAAAGLYGLGAAPGDRALFIVSPSNRIAMALAYPAAVSLNVDEILRLIDSAQMTKYKIATPADWKPGDDMVAGRVLPDPIAAARFGALREVFRYLRFVAHPPWELWRADRP